MKKLLQKKCMSNLTENLDLNNDSKKYNSEFMKIQQALEQFYLSCEEN